MSRLRLAWRFCREQGSIRRWKSLFDEMATEVGKKYRIEIFVIYRHELDDLYKFLSTKERELKEMTRINGEHKYDLKEPFKIHKILNDKETAQVGKYPTLEAAIEDAQILAAANPTSKFFVYSPGDIYQADIPVKSTPFPK